MTEQEWLSCTDPLKLLAFEFRHSGTDRKQRLFTCACCRQVGDIVGDARCLASVRIAEQYADNLADAGDIERAFTITEGVFEEQEKMGVYVGPWPPAALANLAACAEYPELAYSACECLLDLTLESIRPSRQTWGKQVIHCIWGPLIFRPIVIDPCWLTSSVKRVAEAIYKEHAFDRLPILADALEDAGCDNEDILRHCRSEDAHSRGCWPVDLLLKKS